MLNPVFFHEKEYEVGLSRQVEDIFLKKISSGVRLDDGYETRKCQIKRIGAKSFSIILTEGKKRQIRRMCEVLGEKVVELKRVRIMNIKIGRLYPNKFREITGKELKNFLNFLEIK